MNVINETLINETVLKTYQKILTKFDSNRILGIFPIGTVNYGIAEDLDEIHYIAIYIPSFNEICSLTESKRAYVEEEKNLFICDIRACYDINNNIATNLVEILFSKYAIINPIYKNMYEEYFYNKRELIARYNPYRRIENAYRKADEAFQQGNKFRAIRLRIAAERYAAGYSMQDCFDLGNSIYSDYLLNIKHGKIDVAYEDFQSGFEKILDMVQDKFDYDAGSAVKNGVVNIMKFAFEERISKDVFIDTLTDNEKEAFSLVESKVEKEGFVSVSQLLKETTISRPVFNNLFSKIKENKIAEIENKGVKGTYIKWLI